MTHKPATHIVIIEGGMFVSKRRIQMDKVSYHQVELWIVLSLESNISSN